MAYALVESPPRARIPASVKTQSAAVMTLLIVAMITRGLFLGDPTIGGDEQFYLLVADRMWQGALPYVDIWDRKPIGLFLIYAALRPLSQDGILAYQIGAFISATATAFVVTRIAGRFVPARVATAAGCLYLVLLPAMGGGGGQSPVFYNLLMASAGLLVVKMLETSDVCRGQRLALSAMALVGVAIQIKYTAVVEGVSFGCWMLVLRWRRGTPIRRMASEAIAWSCLALLPTALATMFYAMIGHLDAFVFANFASIFLKHARVSEAGNIAANALLIGPILVCASVSFAMTAWYRRFSTTVVFVLIWTLAAFAGFFVIGHFYTHYLLPALVPLSIACAFLLESLAGFALVLLFAALLNINATGFPRVDRFVADRQTTAELTTVLAPYTRYGCLYIAEGPPILYLLTRSCLPSRYVFTEHLMNVAESRAVDQPRGLMDVLGRRPPVITVRTHRNPDFENHEVEALLFAALARDYRFKTRILPFRPIDNLDVWVRRDLP